MGILYAVTPVHPVLVTNASAQTSYKPQYDAIKKLHPKLNPVTTKRVALALAYVHVDPTCTIPWQILLSIAFHESSLRLDVMGLKNPSTKDYGLMQINEQNVKALNLNKIKLLSDPVYSIQVACKILMDARKAHSRTYPFWLGAYRAGYKLSKEKTRQSAESYDRIIRITAKEIGYYERQRPTTAQVHRSSNDEKSNQTRGSSNRASRSQND